MQAQALLGGRNSWQLRIDTQAIFRNSRAIVLMSPIVIPEPCSRSTGCTHPQPERGHRLLVLVHVLLLMFSGPMHAATPHLARDAVSLLRTECFGCHNPEKQKAGLSLTSRKSLRQGSSEGPVIDTTHPSSSRLIKSLSAEADPHMPPKGQLSKRQIDLLTEWVAADIPWDDAAANPSSSLTRSALRQLPSGVHPASALAVSPNGTRLAAAYGPLLILYNLSASNFPALASQQAHIEGINALAWSRDGSLLASSGFKQIRLWNAESLEPVSSREAGLAGMVTALEFAPDGTHLIVADSLPSQLSWVRKLAVPFSADPMESFEAHRDSILDIAVSQDGARLATAGADRRIKVWETSTRKELAVLEGHGAQVTSVSFNTNGQQIASSGLDREIKVWDIATREKLISLGTHPLGVSRVRWASDRQVLLACREDAAVLRYSDLKSHTGEQSSASGQEHRVASPGQEPLVALAISPTTNWLFVGNREGKVSGFTFEGKPLPTLHPPDLPKPVSLRTQASRGTEPKPGAPARVRPANEEPRQKVIRLRVEP
ncbi:MAG: hypothetical protein FJ405_18495, partial [Verrucomicrobia bacterium]|nr:hypothetical protein [Verrucomicrobiota bacterium]